MYLPIWGTDHLFDLSGAGGAMMLPTFDACTLPSKGLFYLTHLTRAGHMRLSARLCLQAAEVNEVKKSCNHACNRAQYGPIAIPHAQPQTVFIFLGGGQAKAHTRAQRTELGT
eukprot:5521332-Amphidinium_carterae.1